MSVIFRLNGFRTLSTARYDGMNHFISGLKLSLSKKKLKVFYKCTHIRAIKIQRARRVGNFFEYFRRIAS